MKWACGVWTYFQKMFFSNMIFVMMIPCITKMRITFVHRTCQEGNGTMKLLIRRHDKWITSYSNRTSHTSSHNLRRDRPTCWNLSPSPCSSKFEAANVQLEHCFYELFSKTVFEKKTRPNGAHRNTCSFRVSNFLEQQKFLPSSKLSSKQKEFPCFHW